MVKDQQALTNYALLIQQIILEEWEYHLPGSRGAISILGGLIRRRTPTDPQVSKPWALDVLKGNTTTTLADAK